MEIARQTFNPEDYMESSRQEGPFICSKLSEILTLAQNDAERQAANEESKN